jgi:RND family efflux transporter MFP subunit
MPLPSFSPAGRAALLILGLTGLPLATASAQTQDRGPSKEVQTARGVVEPRVEATLSSQIAARIARLPVDRGQRVKAGELLVDFDCALERARLRAAQAEQSGAGAKLTGLRRLDQLGSGSRVDIQVATAEAEKAAAMVEQQRIVVERCVINAPYDAIVVDVMAHANDSVEAGKPLVSLLDERSLRLVVLAPSGWAAWLQSGTPLTFTVDETGERIPASVTGLGGRIDATSQTLPVYADIERTGPTQPLVAGMTGTASVRLPSAKP